MSNEFDIPTDEAPTSLLANLVEQLHAESGRERADAWKRLRALAQSVGAMRDIWQ
ncbi:hypothetical protein [Derxia gummosa]|uniref:Uncharacterized protein n=1 Tax=Derxia gummosa DSM 723 TaxID=1121388 RepID=A0A8B6XCU4_9BURK|nr:hypothetical protein [Derxia gummosa]